MDDDVLGQVEREALVIRHRVDDVVVGLGGGLDTLAAFQRIAGDVDLDQLGLLEHARGFTHGGRAQRAGGGGERGDGAGPLALQRDEELSHALEQLGVGESPLSVGQEGQCDDGAGRDGGDRVDASHRAEGDSLGELATAPRGDAIVGVDPCLGHQLTEAEDFAELQVQPSVSFGEYLGSANQAGGVFFPLVASEQLPDVGAFLHEPFVADAHGDEDDVAVGDAQARVDEHVEQAELGRQEFSRSRPGALEEHLDGPAIAEDAAQVGVDDGGVEAVAAERAANEERATAAEDRAGGKEGEVVPRGDERKLQRVQVQHVRQQEVVDVTLVAWQQDQRSPLGGLTNALDAFLVHFQPGVQDVEDALNGLAHREDGFGIGGCLQLAQHAVGACGQQHTLGPAVACQLSNRLRELGAADDFVPHPVRGLAHGAENGAAFPLELAQQRVGAATDQGFLGLARVVAQEVAQGDGLARPEHHMLVVEQELDRESYPAGPVPRTEHEVRERRLEGFRPLGPNEHLRHEHDGSIHPMLQIEQRLDQGVALGGHGATPSVGSFLEDGGRAFEKQDRGTAVLDDLGQPLLRGVSVRIEQGLRPRLGEGFEHPHPEIVGETQARQPVPMRQVVERHEVEERKVPHHVYDRPSLRSVPRELQPRFVDLDVIEETAEGRLQDSVRVVGANEVPSGHGRQFWQGR